MKKFIKSTKFINGGILISSFAFISELSGQNEFDFYQTIALGCFAICIPFIAINFIMVELFEEKDIGESNASFLALLLGILSWIIGIGSIFFHFSIVIGSLFCVAFILSLMILGFSTNESQ